MIELRTMPKSWNATGYDYYQDTDTRRDYKRFAGGVSFPGNLPGFAVILGQALHANPQTKVRDITVLTEIERGLDGELFAGIVELHWRYLQPKWFGDTSEPNEMLLVDTFNRKQADKRKIRLVNAPGVEKPEAFRAGLRMIRDSLSSHRKVLQLGESTLRDRLSNMGPDTGTVRADQHPAIAALGYALSALMVYESGPARFKGVEYVPLDDVVGI